MATEFIGVNYRGAQEAIFGFAPEVGSLAPDATSLGATPILQHAGYYDVPGVETNENSQIIATAGTYRGIELVKGRREHTFRNNIRLGNADILRYGIRKQGFVDRNGVLVPNVKCLPLIAVGTGAVGACDPSSEFAWMGRYGLMREFGVNFQDGPAQPLTANIEIWPLALQEDAAALASLTNLVDDTIDERENAMRVAGGSVMMWHHVSWIVGNVDYRNIISSISLRVTNNLERVSYRREMAAGGGYGAGDAHPLSRVPVAVIPLEETVTVELTLHDKLPASFVNAQADSNLWSEIQIVASDQLSNTIDPKIITFRIAESRLSRLSLNPVGPNALMRFTAGTASRVVSMDVQYL